MKPDTRIEVYDYRWNDYLDTWGPPVRLFGVLPRDTQYTRAHLGHLLDDLMQQAKKRITQSDMWVSSYVATVLQELANADIYIGLYPHSNDSLGYSTSLWRILVRWDHDLARDRCFYQSKCYAVEPTEDHSQMERLEPVDWELDTESELQQ